MRLKHSAPCISFKGTPFIYQGQELGMTNFERGSIDEFDDISSIDQYYRAIKKDLRPKKPCHLSICVVETMPARLFHGMILCMAVFKRQALVRMVDNYKEINAEAEIKIVKVFFISISG